LKAIHFQSEKPNKKREKDTHSLFLDGDIGKMNEHVVHLMSAAIIFCAAETAETSSVQVRTNWSERRNQNIQTQIKFLASYE